MCLKKEGPKDVYEAKSTETSRAQEKSSVGRRKTGKKTTAIRDATCKSLTVGF